MILKSNNQIVYFEDKSKFITDSVEYILQNALSNVASKNFFTIVLSGGSTPQIIYQTLTKSPYKEKFPWDKTYFFLGDERILPPKNSESNTFMLNQVLFSKVSIPDENKILPDLNLNTRQSVALDYEKKLNEYFKNFMPSFDLILLGMGADGHTASLFPKDAIWKNNNNIVISTSKAIGKPKTYRISIGMRMINNSKNILMLIAGQDKKTIAEKLLKSIETSENIIESPIAEISPLGKFTWHINETNARL